jgi:phage shock protein PspC (stress-responsive transcriptional regulator)
MSMTDTFGGGLPPSSDRRQLRRSRTNRVAAGVSSGLGDYFGVDPVLFRVLFATSAFFGGAGILAYLLAWAAIPEAGTEHAPIDGWIAALRRRRVPIWIVAIIAGIILWAVAFSWWAPGPFFPVIAVVVLLIVVFARREMQAPPAPDARRAGAGGGPAATGGSPVGTAGNAAARVDLMKTSTGPDTTTAPTPPTPPYPADQPPPADQPAWVRDARAWFDEARTAARERRRRSLPIRIGVLTTLVATLTALGIADAITGIALQWYFWATLAIVGAGLLAGLVTRRFAASLLALLPPAILGCIAFAGSSASFADGIGQREWKPTTTPAADYRLAFGQGILDLRDLPAQMSPRTVHVTMAAGQVKIIAPKSLNLTVLANVHIGNVETRANGVHHGHGGVGLSRHIDPPAGATGPEITVDVHLADGEVELVRR